MELQHIFWIIALICRVQSETEKQLCEAACEDCFANRDSLKRMGCLEKCIRQDVQQFTCPGSQSFLNVVNTPSPALERDIEDFFTSRSDMFSAKDVAGLAATFTAKSLIVINGQIPVIGRADRAKKLADFFDANPDVDHVHYTPVAFSEENGIIWVNGMQSNFDKQGNRICSYGFMSLLTRTGGKLQEFTLVFFQ
ncbi:uncharacterized protein [Amphiura filiformis]|uniref:uncharacterized protein isoform X2 n=1 Tax=Amphiura filiformis TaxID=82378 RepID=UPI003B20BD15